MMIVYFVHPALKSFPFEFEAVRNAYFVKIVK